MVCDDRVRKAERLVADFDQLSEAEKDLIFGCKNALSIQNEYFTAKCLTDLWWHMQHVIYRPMMHHYYTPLHGPGIHGLATFLQDWTMEKGGVRVPVNEKYMIIARDHCKTQECMAWLSWLFARDVNKRIMIRSHKDKAAEAVLGGTVEIMEMEDYRGRYPWVMPKGGWNKPGKNASKERMMLEREIKGVRTASLMRFGFDSDNTGEHFTDAFYDDWETRDVATSEDLRPELEAKYALDDNVMLGGSKRMTAGTPYWVKAYLHLAMLRKEQFANRDYDLFMQPAHVKVFDVPFTGEVISLQPDRRTFKCIAGGFPTIEANLYLHQAQVTFYSPAAKDNTIEVREIVWNDGMHFRVNRPIPEVLGQPFHYEIGTERPACPNRFTMDDIDLDPNNAALELDSKAPYIEVTQHVRKSLPREERTQGKTTFACQKRLQPMNEEDIVYTWDNVQIFDPKDLPEGQRIWMRNCDIASAKRTSAHTAIFDSFRHETGYYFVHLFHGDPKPTDIIFELCLGVLRLEEIDPGQRFLFTSMEKAANEENLKAFLPAACKDPQAFFSLYPGYASRAKEFEGETNLSIPIKTLPGRKMSKGHRLLGMEPAWEQKKIFISKDIAHMDRIQDEAAQFRPDIKEGFDILDAMNDMVQLSRNVLRVRKEDQPPTRMGRFELSNNKARTRSRMAGAMMEWNG